MLLAFRKCSVDWVESWFPNDEELKQLTDSNHLTGDDTYFLRYSQDDRKRHPVAVSPAWKGEIGGVDLKASAPWYAPRFTRDDSTLTHVGGHGQHFKELLPAKA